MSSQNDPSSVPDVSPQELVNDVVTRFDAYARIRRGRDSILRAPRATAPQQEQRAFDDLAQAITRLRNTLE